MAPDDGLRGRWEAILLKRTVGIRQGYWAAWGLAFGNQSCLNEPIMYGVCHQRVRRLLLARLPRRPFEEPMAAHDFSQSEMLEPLFSHITIDTNDKNPKASSTLRKLRDRYSILTTCSPGGN